jgi:hypothetical protein
MTNAYCSGIMSRAILERRAASHVPEINRSPQVQRQTLDLFRGTPREREMTVTPLLRLHVCISIPAGRRIFGPTEDHPTRSFPELRLPALLIQVSAVQRSLLGRLPQ